MNHFLSQTSCCSELELSLWLNSKFQGRASGSSRMLHTTLPALLSNDLLLCPLKPPPPTAVSSSSASLHCARAAPFLHLSHLATAYLFVEVALLTAVCHTVCICLFCFPQTALCTNTHCKESLVWFVELLLVECLKKEWLSDFTSLASIVNQLLQALQIKVILNPCSLPSS